MGPKPNFNDADMYWALYLMSNGRRICRKDLAEKLGVGEGTVRTIINILRDADMIDTYQTGNLLSELGRSMLDSIPVRPLDLELPQLTLGPVRQALHVFGVADRIDNGWKQRDDGVIAGGSGCTTIIYIGGKLLMPPCWNLDAGNPVEAAAIRGSAELNDGDAIVIGSGDTLQDARRAAIAVAFSLL